MKILKVWDSEYPWDVRAEKVMRSMTSAGHDVHLVARNRRGDRIRETLPEATVHRLRPWSWAGSTLDAASQFPAFLNPRWGGHIRGTAEEVGADVIVVRDLPLAPTAIWAGGKLGIPVALDMAENYPEMIRDIWMEGRQKTFDFLVRNPSLVAKVERWVLERIDHVFVVVEESGARLVDEGLEPGKLTVVCNTPWPDRIPDEDEMTSQSEGGRVRLVYLGLMEKPRGIDAVLRGLATLVDEGLDLHLDLIGDGMDLESFQATARDLGLLDSGIVTFHGRLPYEEALDVIGRSHVGLVPHLPVESWNTTIPNKLFDYMSYGLPVVTSDAKPAARIVGEVGSGAVFRGGDAEDFADAIRGLTDVETRRECGRRGRAAVEEQYNWGVDERALLEGLDALVKGSVSGERSGSTSSGESSSPGSQVPGR